MQASSDRRSFLRLIGGTLAAGVGVVAFAKPAQAAQLRCCRDNGLHCAVCTGPLERYWCTGCNGIARCACAEQDIYGTCFNTNCPTSGSPKRAA